MVWIRRARQAGERSARRQGKPRGSCLDPHEAFIVAMIGKTWLHAGCCLLQLLDQSPDAGAAARGWQRGALRMSEFRRVHMPMSREDARSLWTCFEKVESSR
jgi:hypothetical protein